MGILLKVRKLLIIFALTLFFIIPLAAEENLELSLYGVNRWAAGDMAEHMLCTAGGGFAVEWKLPILPILGVSGRAEGQAALGVEEDIENWWNATFMAGAFVNLPLGSAIILRPELSYGVMLHMVKSPSRDIDGVFADQIIQIAASLRISPQAMKGKGLSIELAPMYTLLTEKTAALHYVGLRAGVNYKL
ncbi:MAG: hypothetical protein J6B81_03190 [Spirochaetaceae bacterium]|nr:hypothetical protein [Spirochaetaceae bacterium]